MSQEERAKKVVTDAQKLGVPPFMRPEYITKGN